ncbi:hypothetical protein OUHCRE14_12080 [Enterobacter hormaechei subsp. hoffmannii]
MQMIQHGCQRGRIGKLAFDLTRNKRHRHPVPDKEMRFRGKVAGKALQGAELATKMGGRRGGIVMLT